MEIKKSINKDDVWYSWDNQGFWYAVTDGGYYKPKEVLKKKEDVKKVEDAIKIVKEYENLFPEPYDEDE